MQSFLSSYLRHVHYKLIRQRSANYNKSVAREWSAWHWHVNPFLPASKWAPPQSVFSRRFLWIWTYARTLWLLIMPRNFEKKNLFLVLFFCVQVYRTQVNYGNRMGMTRGERFVGLRRRRILMARASDRRPYDLGTCAYKDPTYHCRFILWLR